MQSPFFWEGGTLLNFGALAQGLIDGDNTLLKFLTKVLTLLYSIIDIQYTGNITF